MPFTLETKQGDKSSDSNLTTSKLIIIYPKETKISESILLELSVILEKVTSKQQITVVKHFVKEYVSLSRFLLKNNKIKEFKLYTEWFANQI